MIIALSSHSEPKTGAHKRFDRLIKDFKSDSVSLMWITPVRTDLDLPNNVQCLNLKHPNSKRSTSIWLLKEVIANLSRVASYRGKVGVIVTFGETNLLAALFLSLLVKAPLSIGVRSNVPKRSVEKLRTLSPVWRIISAVKSRILHVWLAMVYRLAQHITVQSDHALSEFCNNYKIRDSKIDVIPNDVPTDLVPPEGMFRRAPRPTRLLFIGNASPVKGLDLLFNAIVQLDQRETPFRLLTIVGITQQPSLLAELKSVRLEIVPFVKDIRPLMLSHDLLVVPSREDQFPNVVLEAMALNLPVIGASVDGIKIMLNDPFLLFQPDSPSDLEELLDRVSTREGYGKALALLAERKKHFVFDWSLKYWQLVTKSMRRSG